MKMKFCDTDYLLLFSSCVLCKGANRATINDLARKKVYLIPDELYSMLSAKNGVLLTNAFANFEHDSVAEYCEFLLSAQLAFIVPADKKDLFPALPMQFFAPFEITNAIVDVGEDLSIVSALIADNSIHFLPVLQLRVFNSKVDFKFLLDCLYQVAEKEISSIQLFIPKEVISSENYYYELNGIVKLEHLFVFNATEKKELAALNYHLFFLTKNITSATHCGAISFEQFSPNIETFTESQHHNTCLNRKIAIDTEGNIKNCPSMTESFGNIKDTTLAEAIAKPGFKKHWNITKDQVAICKDCEFRHVCTDCRAYLENPKDIFSKPLKCGYDPYTCEWEEWSTNPLKQRAIEYYDMQDLVKK